MGLRLGVWGGFLLFVADNWNPSIIPPKEGMGTSGEQQESIDSFCSIINFL